MKFFWALGTIHVASAVIPHPVARTINRITKPLLMPLLGLQIGQQIGQQGGQHLRRGTQIALAASTIGDTSLMVPGRAGIAGGIGGFGVAHIAYLMELSPLGRNAPRAVTGALAGGVAAVMGAAALVMNRVLVDEHRPLVIPVVGYAGLCAAMAATAVRAGVSVGGRRGRSLALGGALFVISDSMVAAALFGPARWDATGRLTAAIMATYLAAQTCLVRGLTDQG